MSSSNFNVESLAVAEGAPRDRTENAGAARGLPPSRSRRHGIDWAQRLEIAVLSGPAILMFLGFVIFPVLMAAYYGFYRWKGFGVPTNFVGLKNYITILQDSAFREALWHNALIVVLSLILQGPIALGFALLLNQKVRGQSIIRVLIFVPYVIAEVIVGTAWALLLQTNGAVNDFFRSIGLGWLAQ